MGFQILWQIITIENNCIILQILRKCHASKLIQIQDAQIKEKLWLAKQYSLLVGADRSDWLKKTHWASFRLQTALSTLRSRSSPTKAAVAGRTCSTKLPLAAPCKSLVNSWPVPPRVKRSNSRPRTSCCWASVPRMCIPSPRSTTLSNTCAPLVTCALVPTL